MIASSEASTTRRVLRPLFVSPYGRLGGAQLVLLGIIDAMGPDLEPRGLVMADGPFADMLRARGVPTDVVSLPGKQAVRSFNSAARAVAERLRGEDISLVHANGIKAAIFGAPLARRLGVPLVWMKHDHVLDGFASNRVAGRCDAVICVSDTMRERFAPSLRGRISVVYPGTDPPKTVKPIGDELRIVAVGRLDPAKGFDTLLRATRELRDRGIDTSITVAGPVDDVFPHHAGELRSLVDELDLGDHAEEVGWIDDLAELYDKARVVAMASKPRPRGGPGEGAPIVLLEGMAHGRPVVAPREGGISEIVGDAGTLVEQPDVPQLVAALEPYLKDPALATEIGARGAVRVRERFTLEHTVEALRAAYISVL